MAEVRLCKFSCGTELAFDSSNKFGTEIMTKKLHNWTRCYEVMKTKGLFPPDWFLKRVEQEQNRGAQDEAYEIAAKEKNSFALFTNGHLLYIIHKGKKMEIGHYDDKEIFIINEGIKPFIRQIINTPRIMEEREFNSQIARMDQYWREL